jgi:hypothetical protein
MCTAIVYVDDATSRLMVVRFAGTESTFAYFEASREYLARHGKPLAFYSDKASIFRVNQPAAINGPGYTQFGRALFELNIEGICANTAAAKGRVERAHLTLQDRLVKELRLEGISSIEAANAFMPRFIEDYNTRFAKEPRDAHNAHRPLRADEELDLIFCWRELRKVTKALTLHYRYRPRPCLLSRPEAVAPQRLAALPRQRCAPAVKHWNWSCTTQKSVTWPTTSASLRLNASHPLGIALGPAMLSLTGCMPP